MSTEVEERERDFFGRHYEEGFTNPVGVRLRIARELAALRSRVGGRAIGRVLSIGCGDGVFECLLARHAESVLGIDFSPDAIEKARERAAALGLKNVEFHLQTVAGLREDESFDGVVCIGLLHHVPAEELAGLLERLRAHLRPGAFFFAREPSRKGFLRAVGRLVLGARYDRYHSPDERELDPDEVARALVSAGFDEPRVGWIDVTLIPGHYLFPHAPGWLMRLFTGIDRVFCATPLARWASGFTLFATGAEPEAASADMASRFTRYLHLDRVTGPYLDWQLEQIRPWLGQRVLEIGCGVGGIVERLGPRERIVGIDRDPEILDYTRRRFQDRPDYSFLLADLGALSNELRAQLEAERFDTIVCINVLEHMRDDVGALLTLERLLAPGGTLALLVPAHALLYGEYDRLDGHWRRYGKSELRTLLSHTRLDLLRLHYFNAVGALGWWLQYRVLRRSFHDQSHFGLMNRLLPLVRPLEARLKPPFGLSLVAVCRRESGR